MTRRGGDGGGWVNDRGGSAVYNNYPLFHGFLVSQLYRLKFKEAGEDRKRMMRGKERD